MPYCLFCHALLFAPSCPAVCFVMLGWLLRHARLFVLSCLTVRFVMPDSSLRHARLAASSCPAPTGHLLDQVRIINNTMGQILPLWIYGIYKLILPFSFEVLQLFFSSDCLFNRRKLLEVYQFVAVVFRGKDRAVAIKMFFYSSFE